jgi:predicted small lipoprotein YifL
MPAKHIRSGRGSRGYTVAADGSAVRGWLRRCFGCRNCLQGDVMRMFRPLFVPMLLALVLCACGNKGDLVKPMPSKLPPPTTTPDSTAPQPDTAAKPAQDSGGH